MVQFSKENLLELLDQLKTMVQDDTLDAAAQEELWKSIIHDKDDPEYQEMLKYLFTGWWVHSNISENKILSCNNE